MLVGECMSKYRKILLFVLLVFLFGSILTIVINLYMINGTKNQIIEINQLKELKNIDAILVLGCKVEGNSPSIMLANRLDKAYDVYNMLNTKLLLSGDHGKKDYDEVDVMRDYLKNMNVMEDDIVLDHAGFSTYDSIYRAKNVFNMKKVIIVTQNYHMYRALYLANKLDLEAVGVIALDVPQKGIMLKNEIREIFSRDKNFIKGILKPTSKYL